MTTFASQIVDHPSFVTPPGSVVPVPRRIRGYLGGRVVFDTTNASYVWEHSRYPQYYVPMQDVLPGLLEPEGHVQHSPFGTVETHGLKHGSELRPHAAKVVTDSPIERLKGSVRFNWEDLDAWFEEDEQVFVHPRNPYVRVDAMRSTRRLRIELDGVILAETSSPVMLFETGLPTRYYINWTDVQFEHLLPSDTVTSCPYKGTTTRYWSADLGDPGGRRVDDIAWSYEFPRPAVVSIAGLIAFYNEKVDIFIDGQRIDSPPTKI